MIDFHCVFSEDDKRLIFPKFPLNIIYNFLSSEDEFLQSKAVLLLKNVYNEYSLEQVVSLFSKIVEIAKVTKSHLFVNQTYLLARKLIKCNEYQEYIIDLIYSTLQGRISLLEHNYATEYESESFKFYKLLSTYVSNYPLKSLLIIQELIDWLPNVSISMVEKLLFVINSILTCNDLPSNLVTEIWVTLIQQLARYSSYLTPADSILGCLVSLREFYPSLCKIEDLLTIMNGIWEESIQDDEEMICLLSTIYLDLFSNEEMIQIPPNLWKFIMNLIISEQFEDLDYSGMLSNVIKIINKSGEVNDLYQETIRLLFHFLVMDDKTLKQKYGIKKKLKNQLIECMKSCVQNSSLELDDLLCDYEKEKVIKLYSLINQE